ncbi:lanthionine synthetase C family protein [Clostridium paraputrificum]|uniref:lanthionine synthetase C family protein n=1 Tax=Clostridium paraputrificum TaxID=29363 RepID=UPI003D33CF6A
MSILEKINSVHDDIDTILNKVFEDLLSLNNVYKNFFDDTVDNKERIKNCVNNIPAINIFLSEIDNNQNHNEIKKAQEFNLKFLKKYFNYYNKNVSAFSGLLDLGYSLQSIESEKSMLNIINNSIKSEVLYFLKSKVTPNISICENINGIAGISRYLLNYIDDNKAYFLNKELLLYLIDFIIKNEDALQISINCNNDALKSGIISFGEKLDFGLAHGIAGILSILSIACIKNINLPKQKEAIKICINFYMNNIISRNNVKGWPKKVTLNDINRIPDLPISYTSWCYGSIGILRTLFIGSVAVNDRNMITEVLHMVNLNLANCKESLEIFSPTFCHGYSGYMYILNLFYKDTQNVLYKEKVTELIKKTIEFYQKDKLGGFYNYELINNKIITQNNLNSVDGIVSVLLPLLSVKQGNRTNWDNKFLINKN